MILKKNQFSCLCVLVISCTTLVLVSGSMPHRNNKPKTGDTEHSKIAKRSHYYGKSLHNTRRYLPYKKTVNQKSHARSLYTPYNVPLAYAYTQPAPIPAPSPYSYDNSYPSYYPAPAPAPAPAPFVYLYTSAYPGTQIQHAAPNEDTQPNRDEVFTIKGESFKSIGCWTDNMGLRAINPLEGKHPALRDSNYKARSNALMKCAEAALDKKYKLLALQNGGQCFGQGDQFDSYKKYGPSYNCKGDGEGGPLSNEVYSFMTGNKTVVPDEQNQNGNSWSSWSQCGEPCGGSQGMQTRNRTCNTPSVPNGCTGYETRPCTINICIPNGQIVTTQAPTTPSTTPPPPPLPTTPPPPTTQPPPPTTAAPSTTAAASSAIPVTATPTQAPSTAQTTLPPTTPSPITKPVCKAKVDLGFLIDGSGSIESQGTGNFRKVKDFVKDLVNEFEVSQHGTHIGAILFDHRPKVVFGFNKYATKQPILSEIDRMQYPRGGTMTGKALTLAQNGLYKTSSRHGIPKILIVITDGQSRDKIKVPAQELRDLGVTIYAVGIGKNYVEGELKEMATDPDTDHVFTAGFNELKNVVQTIKDRACQGAGGATASTVAPAQPTIRPQITPTGAGGATQAPITAATAIGTTQAPTAAAAATAGGTTQAPTAAAAATAGGTTQAPTAAATAQAQTQSPTSGPSITSPTAPGVCKAKIDLGILLDASGSIEMYGKGNFKKCLAFIGKLIQEFDIGPSLTRVGVVKFSSNANVEFGFNQINDKQSIIAKVNAIFYSGRGTYTGKALRLCKTGLFETAKRPNVNRMLLVMTDGMSMDGITAPSKALRDSGVTVYCLGIGKNYKLNELNTMATDPDADHVFTAGFDQLDSVIQQLKDKACRAATTGSGVSPDQTGTTQGRNRDQPLQPQEEVFEVTEDGSLNRNGPDDIAVDKPEPAPLTSSNNMYSDSLLPTQPIPADNRIPDDGESFVTDDKWNYIKSLVPSRRRSKINKTSWKSIFYKERKR